MDPVTAYDQPLAAFNRYDYAANNPYRFTDPDGRFLDEIVDAGFMIYDGGRFLGAVAAVGVGKATNNDALVDAGMEGLKETGGAFAMDVTAAAIPGVAAPMIKGAERGVEAARGAGKAEDVQEMANLNKQMASEQQMGELASGQGVATHGAGTSRPLEQGDRLASQYGGQAGDYQKVTSSAYKAADGGHVETHAFKNANTGQIIEPKTVIRPNERTK